MHNYNQTVHTYACAFIYTSIHLKIQGRARRRRKEREGIFKELPMCLWVLEISEFLTGDTQERVSLTALNHKLA